MTTNSIDSNKLNQQIIFLLQIACIALFIGRGWQFLAKSTPFFSFFLNGFLMHPIVKYIYGISSTEHLNNPVWYDFYKKFIHFSGVFLLLSSVTVIWVRKLPLLWLKVNLRACTLLLFFMAFCYFLSKGLQIGQLLEYALQIGTPIFLLVLVTEVVSTKDATAKVVGTVRWMKIALSATFVGHGLYAIGFHPLPGHFVDMMIKGFHINEDTATLLLTVIGWLDIIAAAVLLIPLKTNLSKNLPPSPISASLNASPKENIADKLFQIALYYMLIWGFLTTFARLYANFHWSSGWYNLKQWLPEVLMRFPHFIIPVILLWCLLHFGQKGN